MKRIDITGQRFGRLIVLEMQPKGQWKCVCDCGNITFAKANTLRRGSKKSCGCIYGHRKLLQYIDLTGEKYGKLRVVNRSHNILDKSAWKCLCECGNEVVVRGEYLKSGHTKSCGCLKIGNTSTNWNGYGEISSKIWDSIKRGAEKRFLEFSITIEFAWELFISQERKCNISGIPIYFPSKTKSSDGNASLDRIDPSKGYIVGNVQWVHKKINIIKWDLQQHEFIDLCKIVVNYQQLKEKRMNYDIRI